MKTAEPEEKNVDVELDPDTLIATLNEKLISAGASNAELAFGLGCSISIVPLGIVLLLLYILGVRGWVTFGLLILIGVLLATAISTYLASRARKSAISRTFDREIEPAILEYLGANQLDRYELQQMIDDFLPGDAPLKRYFSGGEPSALTTEE